MIRAAVLHAFNEPLSVEEIALWPPGYGQVRVRVLVSGICGAQLQEIDGHKGAFLPRLMGHEGCGIVEETGYGVRHVKTGDQVVMHWRAGDGIESEFPQWTRAGTLHSCGKITTFGEQVVVSENRVTAVPRGTPPELCALMGCGLSTALGTIESEAEVRFGETVLIIGCGGLGLNLILAAKMAHAARIVAVDIHASKRMTALAMGATEFFCAEDLHDDAAAPMAFDAIIDTSGNPATLARAIPMLAPSGRFVMVGQPKPGESVSLENARHFFDGEGKSFRATQGGRFRPGRDIPRYTALHRAGLLDTGSLVSHRLSLDEINEGIALVRAGQAGRVMIFMEK